MLENAGKWTGRMGFFFQDNIPPSSFLLLTSTSQYCLPIFDSLSIIDINIPVRKGLLTWRSWGMKRLLACLSTQGRDHWRERKSLMSLFIWPTLLSWGWKSIGCISKFPTVPLNLSHKAGNKKESRVAVSTHSIIPRSNISRYYSITEITFVTEY